MATLALWRWGWVLELWLENLPSGPLQKRFAGGWFGQGDDGQFWPFILDPLLLSSLPFFACFQSWRGKRNKTVQAEVFCTHQELSREGVESEVGEGGQVRALWAAPGASPLLGLQLGGHVAFVLLPSWGPSSRALQFGWLQPWPRKGAACSRESHHCQTLPDSSLMHFLSSPKIWSLGHGVRESGRHSGSLGHWFMIISRSKWDTCVSQVALEAKNPPPCAGDLGDLGLIPGLGRSSGGENGNPLQYSCLKNPLDRGVWQAIVHGVAKSQTQLKQLSTHAQSSAGVGVMWVK